MLDFLQGQVIFINPTSITLLINGIAYRLLTPIHCYEQLKSRSKEIVRFYVSLVVRENSLSLYGFLCKKQRGLFEVLIHLSGIGPKTALSLISHLGYDNFLHAVKLGDSKIITKVPGIGKKMSERIILEMKDKSKDIASSTDSTSISDAILALINLGYSPMQSRKAVEKATSEIESLSNVGEIISSALKKI